MRIVLSGGGTGGHIWPLLAIATELKKIEPKIELLYVGSKGSMEEKLVPAAQIPYTSIPAGKMRRYGWGVLRTLIHLPTTLANLRDLVKVASGFAAARKILKKFSPEAVMLKGGYVSLPVGLAAKTLNIPFAIHESDAVPGKANKFLSRWAERVFVSFPISWELPREKLVWSGNPIRSDITPGNAGAARTALNLTPDGPVVMFIGGSLGAYEINRAVWQILEPLLQVAQVIHISGDRDFAWLNHEKEKLPRELGERYRLFSYLSAELPDAYRAADLVVTRASAGVLAEISAVGRPSIIIPHQLASGHQLKNAQVYGREGAASILRPEELTGEVLLAEIGKVLADPAALAEKSRRAAALSRPDAAAIIARELKLMIERRRRGGGGGDA